MSLVAIFILGVTIITEWNEVMRLNLSKLALHLVIAVLACIGLLSTAHATPIDTAQPTATETVLATETPMTTQYIFEKYITQARHRCWDKRVRISRYCCGFDYYGACSKYCFQYGYRKVCPRHKRYYRKRRRSYY